MVGKESKLDQTEKKLGLEAATTKAPSLGTALEHSGTFWDILELEWPFTAVPDWQGGQVLYSGPGKGV